METKISGRLIITSYKYEKFHKESVTHSVACFIADNRLEYLKVIQESQSLPAGTILTARVNNVVNSIPAAFVALDKDSHMGFLSLEKVKNPIVLNRNFKGSFSSGDQVLVQVVREPMKTKEALVTADISMDSNFSAVKFGTGRLLFSKKLSTAAKAEILDYLVSKAVVTRDKRFIGREDVDVTIRTAAQALVKEKHLDKLVKDIANTLLSLDELINKARTRSQFTVHKMPVDWMGELYKEISACGFEITDYITDDLEMYKELEGLLSHKQREHLQLYQDKLLSLQALYGLQSKIEELTKKRVWLPGGGYLIIEPTEALIAVDVNSGKSVSGKDNQVKYFETNMEAADELLRQLRLRNLSGMIVADFINMQEPAMKEALMSHLSQNCKRDFSKVQVVDMTGLGLVELIRNKKSKALHEVL